MMKSTYGRFEDEDEGEDGRPAEDEAEAKHENGAEENGKDSGEPSLRAAAVADDARPDGAPQDDNGVFAFADFDSQPAPAGQAGAENEAEERSRPVPPLLGGPDGPEPPRPANGQELSPGQRQTPTVLGKAVIDDDGSDGLETIELDVVGVPGQDTEPGKKAKVKLAETKSLASSRRTFINAIICFIGTGMYGLPAAFQRIGTMGGLFGMAFVSSVSLHCMFLVVDCRTFLQQEKSKQIRTYGDIGYYAFGSLGARLVDFFVALTQLGACIAYLIVIAQSMHEVVRRITKRQWIVVCMPLLVRASWLRSLKSVAPLSLVAELGTGIAAVIVLVFDMLQIFDNESGGATLGHDDTNASAALAEANATLSGGAVGSALDDPVVLLNLQGIPYFFGVSIYTFEGIGMVIPVYNSMRTQADFKSVWGLALVCVAFLNTSFGFLGYYAYRSSLADMIISNLPEVPVTIFMKVSLCVGLVFTYPIMMFPVIEMAEESLQRPATTTWLGAVKWNMLRTSLVLATAVVASCVPRFTFFIALIGASGGAALAFVLPSAFHLKLRWKELNGWRRWREMFCIVVGVVGGVVGTGQAIKDLKAALDAGQT